MQHGGLVVSAARAPVDLVAGLNAEAGCGLQVVGTAELGETGGAALVEWPDGRPGVVSTATVPVEVMAQTARALEVARAAGCPVPRHELVVELRDGTVAVVQERLPGDHPVGVDGDLVDLLVAADDGFADLLVGRGELALPRVQLPGTGSAALVAPLQQHGDRSRRLLRQLRRLDLPTGPVPGEDLVHSDLTVSNALLGAGRVSGLVDWNNGAFRGDRRSALVKLLFDLTWEAAAPAGGRHRVQAAGLRRLEAVLRDTTDPTRLQAYWAHWTVQMLHWTIRSGDAGAVDLHLDLGERVLG